jgi:starch synthase (maltosyl-transferring)
MKKEPKLQSTGAQPSTGSDQSRSRAVIENVKPEIDCGRFPAKRTVGEIMTVEADIFADGYDALSALLLYRKEGASTLIETPMNPLVNDRWRGTFEVKEIGNYYYTLQAWVDRFKSWRQGFAKKVDAGQDVALDLLAGSRLIEEAAKSATADDHEALRRFAAILREDPSAAIRSGLSDALASLMKRYSDRRWAVTYGKELRVNVERAEARFSTWYELFPRSFAGTPGAHGSLHDLMEHVPYVAEMGFDVLYLPPIHPIGYAFRKGKNNTLAASADDVGSPWAIGAKEGGHKAIHPQLGSLADFQRLVAEAKKFDMEIALDIAFQCTPDHPYVTEHPEWFRKRRDGSIQYAENPPKKYQDIYPLDFESENWEGLWNELKSVILFWCEQGVRIFRADNPHT